MIMDKKCVLIRALQALVTLQRSQKTENYTNGVSVSMAKLALEIPRHDGTLNKYAKTSKETDCLISTK